MTIDRTPRAKMLLSTAAAAGLLLALSAPALAHQPSNSSPRVDASADSQVSVGDSESRGGVSSLSADLDALNGSRDRGDVSVEAHGPNRVTVSVRTTGVSPNAPHAQHIHIGGRSECPTERDDVDNNGLVTTAEGQAAYGPIGVSLTTEGDVSADSALAVSRFPTANENGVVDYERTFSLPEGVTVQDLREGVVVQHGIAELFADSSAFDGDAASSVNPDLPLEAVIPASCGQLSESSILGLEIIDELLNSSDNGNDTDRNRGSFLGLGL